MTIGDIVQVHDGSWAMEFIGGEWKKWTHPAMERRKQEKWQVVAMDGDFVNEECSRRDGSNNTLLLGVSVPGRLLSIQQRFIHPFQPTLEDRVSQLEKAVAELQD